jgi:hypothetical protein
MQLNSKWNLWARYRQKWDHGDMHHIVQLFRSQMRTTARARLQNVCSSPEAAIVFNLKKLNEVEDKEQYCVEVSNRFAILEDLDAEAEINSAWETIRENIKISPKESLGYFELQRQKS